MLPRIALATLTTLALAVPAAAAPTTYALGGGHLAVKVRYDRDALVKGHDHILSSTGYSGTVTWDPEDASACDVSITLPVQTLQVDAPGMREAYGLEGSTSDGDRRSIKKNALSKGQLHAEAHPTITYRSTSCSAEGSTMKVVGVLTIRGASKTVTTQMDIDADGSSFSGKGMFTATHSDFGFDPYTALFGSLRNDETLTFYVATRGTPK